MVVSIPEAPVNQSFGEEKILVKIMVEIIHSKKSLVKDPIHTSFK